MPMSLSENSRLIVETVDDNLKKFNEDKQTSNIGPKGILKNILNIL